MKNILNRFATTLTENFWISVSLLFILKLSLAFYFPLTGDEAYFLQWGKHLYPTFYDHSAMTGLWVYLGQLLGHHVGFARSVAIFSQFLIFLGVYSYTQRVSKNLEKAKLVSLAFLVSPVLFLFFMVTTDSPLFFFACLAAVSFSYGLRKDKALGFILSGAFLGLGLFSKYLIFFVGLGMAIATLFTTNKKKIPLYWGYMALGLLPFAYLHFYWAQNNCWWPLQFNIFNRAEGKGFQLSNFMAFVFQQLFLMTPWLAWYALKQKKDLIASYKQNCEPLILIFAISFVTLGLLSFLDTGLHWGLSIYSLLYLSLWAFSENSLKNILSLSTIFTLVLSGVILLALSIAPKYLKGQKHYNDYVMGSYGNELHQQLQEKYNVDAPIFATLAYTTSGIMEYFSRTPYIVFNSKNYHGRNDDQWTNYKELNGRSFVIVSLFEYNEDSIKEYQQYFSEVKYDTIEIQGGQFFVAVGSNFNYEAYKEIYLKSVNEKFYTFKDYLPEGQCFFKKKYFQ